MFAAITLRACARWPRAANALGGAGSPGMLHAGRCRHLVPIGRFGESVLRLSYVCCMLVPACVGWSDAQQHAHVAPISGSAHVMRSEGPVDHGQARGTQHAYVHG